EALVRAFMNDDIPFTREMIVKGGAWLRSGTNKTAGLHALKQMISKQLPFTHTVYDSLLQAENAPPLYKQLGELAAVINNSAENSPAMRELRRLLAEIIP